ncbi:MAG: hypothetical protein ACLP9K_08915 [Nitrososphaerales archaeon]
MKSRQVSSGSVSTIVYFIWFVIGVYVLVWFYTAVKRIEKSLREIEKRLESQTGKDTRQTESTA